MTPEDFTQQLNAAQDEFAHTTAKLAYTESESEHPYLAGIARCVATLNVLQSARETDWDRMALDAGNFGELRPGKRKPSTEKD